MSDIVLASGVRSNLLSLQKTSNLLELTQGRLATGKKVNSALDNPNNFFTASSLSDRSKDLSKLLDSMGQSIQSLRAADSGIKAITKLVEAGQAKANQALQNSDATIRATFAGEFNELLSQLFDIAGDSGYSGKNLLGGDNLQVNFNEDASSQLTITAVDYTDGTGGLTLTNAANSWADDTDINAAVAELEAALTTLRSQAATFGTNMTVVQNRQDFTKEMMNSLQVGADLLILADQNEEGANLLALQTRQQLSTQSLSMAVQADQSVLSLF